MQLPRRAVLSAPLALAMLLVMGGVVLAASLSLGGGSLGAARASTPRCTAAELDVEQNLSSAKVTSVTVSTLPATCGGATLKVSVNNATTSSSGSVTVPAGGGSVTVTLAAGVAVGQVDEIDVVLTGP